MSFLHSNQAVNKIGESLIPDIGMMRSLFNGVTEILGGPMTEEGISKLGTEAERTAQRKKAQKLGITAQSLTDAEKTNMEMADYGRKYIEDNFGNLEAGQVGQAQLDQYRNAMFDKGYSKSLADMSEAERATYDAYDDAQKAAHKKEARDKFNSAIKPGTGTVAEQLNDIYNRNISTYNDLYQKSHISDMARLKSMFLDNEGKLSKGRAIGLGAGVYGISNIVGSGSLGIPFISTASWNR